MDNVIYHSKDLDGLMSAAIVHNYQTSFWEPCRLFPYDYGELLDTRKFKGKSAVMIDVSMPMERMELLSTSCMEFMWIDHHISAYNDLIEFCEEQGYPIERVRVNDLIERIEVKKMNLIYYYSHKLSGCELTAILFDKNLGKTARKIINTLGQYDTWRDIEEKKFVDDEDWNDVVLPFQYGFRAKFNDPERISDYLERINNYDNHDGKNSYIVTDIQDLGKAIIGYQEKIDETNMKANSFEMDFVFKNKTYKAICLNTSVFSSNVFKSVYYEGYHDIMIGFQYRGSTDKYKFSMYTTKDDVNILEIAKSFGGGGHAQACGFEINAVNINIQKSVISIFNNKRVNHSENVGTLLFDEEEEMLDVPELPALEIDPSVDIVNVKEEEEKKVTVPRGYMYKQSVTGKHYWIYSSYSKKFEDFMALINGENVDPKDQSAFEEIFSKFETPNANLCPAFLYDKLKDKL